jgi:hypothetical protein
VRREQDFVVLFDLPTLLASTQSALDVSDVGLGAGSAQRAA